MHLQCLKRLRGSWPAAPYEAAASLRFAAASSSGSPGGASGSTAGARRSAATNVRSLPSSHCRLTQPAAASGSAQKTTPTVPHFLSCASPP